MLRIKLVKSPIAHTPKVRATIQALGLRKINAEVEKEDSPVVRGQIQHVKELLYVTDDSGAVIWDGRTGAKRSKKDKKPSETH